ncbi:MAG: Do family serine endopeptidase [Betaproteobacteria bacterium]|nr:MAG: Do family serine endopeptidase [Betaproteobacteria bacterium]
MNKRQFFFGLVFASFLGALMAVGGMQFFIADPDSAIDQQNNTQAQFTNYLENKDFTVPDGLNFIYAAEISTPTVVHIRSTFEGRSYGNSMEDFWEFFGYRQPNNDRGRRPQSRGFGSGVIISEDGYIITNNHVIDHAGEIEVTLADKRNYDARLIGSDPNTDLALLKIEERQLPYINIGDSDKLRIGEWVLAVGNPFAQGTPYDLTSTVTAGIVSAKARNINILGGRNYGIESFIQTDAAVNPGNSGGALVNLKGELVGINTAIATPSRTFAGYSFAVPSSLVKKVINDLREYGIVQRALLGVQITDVTADFAESRDIDEVGGVYILDVGDKSAAKEAGLKEGDIIINIGGTPVKTTAELQELVARNSPGDRIAVTYMRDEHKYTTNAVLKNFQGNTEVLTFDSAHSFDGAVFKEAEDKNLEKLNLRGGIVIDKVGDGKWKDAGIKPGFIITHVNKTPVENVDQVLEILRNRQGGNLIEGIYPNGEERYYAIGW